MTKQIKQTLIEKAEERENKESGTWKANLSLWLVNIGVGVSAILTMLYLTLLVAEAIEIPSPFSYIFGVIVGFVAVVPAELALIIWRERLAGESRITKNQKKIAMVAMIFAGIFSALTTSSFFSYFLPQLFPASYIAIAPSINIFAIVGSWIVFILSIVGYDINSRQTQSNLDQAEASQKVQDARTSVLLSSAEAIRLSAEGIVQAMDDDGVFAIDARALIMSALGINGDRAAATPLLSPVAQQQTISQTAVSAPHKQEQIGFKPHQNGGQAEQVFASSAESKHTDAMDSSIPNW